jgi:hypothetical protein
MRDDGEYYRILLANDWQLTDLYEFPRAYSQNYAFIYCFDSERDPKDRSRIDYALANYPWLGGYSYVNIYTVLQNQIPQNDRPSIRSLRKESPGWIELFLNLDVAIQLAAAVASLAGSAAAATYSYKNIHKYLGQINIDRKKHQLQEMQITEGQAKVLTEMSVDMAKFLGFKSLKQLHEHTGDPEITLRLLLAHYRRISILVEYAEKNKAMLPLEGDIENREY